MKPKWFVMAVVSTVALALAPAAWGKTLVVDNDAADCPNAQFTSIQAAVNAAQAGDTIRVCRGTYEEAVTIATPAKNNLRVRAQGPRGAVVVDANDALAGFLLENVSGVVTRGFTVQEGHESNIWLRAGANQNRITRNVARGPSGHDGIRLDGANGNWIVHNVAFGNGNSVNGCGIDLLTGSSGNIVRHNLVFDNDRAGIRLLAAGSGNVVRHNRANSNGRNGILNQSTPGTRIAHNRTHANTGVGADLGHGIRLTSSSGVTVAHNKSRNNTGDGIRADSDATGNVIARNRMSGNVEHDCHDDSAGTGTAGTANLWVRNHGLTENRPGLCKKPGAP